MRRNKKGDLSLSINAIVILILAITMLGLGLAFMRNIFGSATKEFEEVGGTVKKQMIDQMKESTKIVELSRPKIDLKIGEGTQVFIGFKNEGLNPKKFTIIDDPLKSKTTSLGGNADNCFLKEPASSKGAFLEFKAASTTVLSGDVSVIPINVKTSASNVKADTCYYELQVDYEDTTDPADKGSVTIELTVDITS